MRIGLTGGIGSGKSTVSKVLAGLGAVIVDADLIAREVVEPGTPGLAAIRAEFGAEVLQPDGSLDRPALGAVVFADPERRRALEAITHPLIGQRTQELFAQAPTDAVVVHDMPLLVELGQTDDGYHLMLIVDVPEEVRLTRLVEQRGMTEADARARIGAQATDAQRREAADVLLDNSGTPEELTESLTSLWHNRIRPYADNLVADRAVRRPNAVSITEPDPTWAAQGRRLSRRLVHQLGRAGFEVEVDHIGSTSVPGLAAKDVIDLQVRVSDLGIAENPTFREALRAAGFVDLRPNQDEPKPWAPDPEQWRKLYANGADPARVTHLHVRTASGPAAQVALQFRDWLRANDAERDAYAAVKREIARAHPGGSPEAKQDYVQAKEPWFAAALPRAREWARATGWANPSTH